MKIRHKIGELISNSGLSYSQFGRKAGIGMRTAKELYDNPYYQLETPTLMKCAQFFGKEPGELVVDEDVENPISSQEALATKAPSDPEFVFRFLALVVPDYLLEQVRKVAPKGLVAFVVEAIAEKLERDGAENSNLPTSEKT